MKVVIADTKNGKSYQRELDGNQSKPFYGMKIGQEFDGGLVGLSGYKVVVTGGTDRDGFPMRPDFKGQGRKRILLSDGPGFRPDAKGKRVRKTVRGNIIAADIAQLNVKVKTYGTKKVSELLGAGEKKEEKKPVKEEKEKKPEPGKGEAKPEPKKEEKKPEAKPAERKPEPKKEQKPEQKGPKPEKKEEKKPEPKPTEKQVKEEKKEQKPEQKEPKQAEKKEEKPEKKEEKKE